MALNFKALYKWFMSSANFLVQLRVMLSILDVFPVA